MSLVRRPFWALLVVFWGLSQRTPPAFGQSPDEALSERAFQILDKYCGSCHAPPQTEAGLTILDYDQLVRPSDSAKPPYITPKDLSKSWVYQRALKQDMPPDYEDRKTYPFVPPDDLKRLEEWINAGAPEPLAKREPLDDLALLKLIHAHLEGHRVDGPYLRYFHFQPLHNNRRLRDQTLEIYRAGLSKLLNSLHWQELVIPESIDPQRVIFVVDLRRIGWDAALWRRLRSHYPYGIRHTNDENTLDIEKDIERLSGDRRPYLRGDWFIATASRAPLYDDLLGLPATLGELEKRLKINLAANFENNVLQRAGFVTSGVSRHNRLVERHPLGNGVGAYWRSYDFRSSDGKGNLVQFPLGPISLKVEKFQHQAFVHAGGEVIFNLPNGLQAYMLADEKDRRLTVPAPVDVVRDLKESAGSPAVVNGLSCISCHREGMRSFRDAIRDNPAVFDEALIKVRRLYPPQNQMNELVEQDRRRFLVAEARATIMFYGLQNPESEETLKNLAKRAEPIAFVARAYLADLSPEVVAAELGLRGAADLNVLLKSNQRLKELGLGPLLALHGLKRELWERPILSLFQIVAQELGYATD